MSDTTLFLNFFFFFSLHNMKTIHSKIIDFLCFYFLKKKEKNKTIAKHDNFYSKQFITLLGKDIKIMGWKNSAKLGK